MGLGVIGDVKIDGALIKDSLKGATDFFEDIKTLFTGEVSPEKKTEILEKAAIVQASIQQGQIEIGKIEAASASVFVSGWRPALGWVCAASLGAYYIPQALVAAILWAIQCAAVMYSAPDISKVILPEYPIVYNIAEILGLVASLLGIGGLRTTEKIKGVARN